MGVKISDLPNITLPYSGLELIPMVQSGETRAGSLSSIANLLSGVLLADTELAQLSGVWQSTYSTTQANSARWTSVYSTVCALSAAWEESADILPTVTNYLSSNNVLLSSVTVTDYVKDGSNMVTIDPNNRRLITSTGSILLDWSNAGAYGVEFSNGASLETNALFFADGSSNYYSIQESTLKDASNQTGVNWASRQLMDTGSVVVLDWSSSTAGIAVAEGVPLNVDILYDAGAPLNYIDIVNGEIGGYSGTNVPSIDWINRELVGDDGTTVALDWSDGTARFAQDGAGGYYFWIDNGGYNTPSGRYDGDGIRNPSGDYIIELNNRLLIASDGTTVAADWSTGTPAFAQGATFVPTAVASLTGGEGTIAYVNDANTPVIGSAVVGGGSAKCLVCYNGTSWIVTSLL